MLCYVSRCTDRRSAAHIIADYSVENVWLSALQLRLNTTLIGFVSSFSMLENSYCRRAFEYKRRTATTLRHWYLRKAWKTFPYLYFIANSQGKGRSGRQGRSWLGKSRGPHPFSFGKVPTRRSSNIAPPSNHKDDLWDFHKSDNIFFT